MFSFSALLLLLKNDDIPCPWRPFATASSFNVILPSAYRYGAEGKYDIQPADMDIQSKTQASESRSRSGSDSDGDGDVEKMFEKLLRDLRRRDS